MSINSDKMGLTGKEKIIKISTAAPIFCYGDEKVFEVVEKIVKTGHRRIPIVSKNKEVTGILTKSDLLDAFLRKEDFGQKISTIMTRDVIKCESDDSIAYVSNKFKISRRGGLPVVEKNKLVGMVSERDFIKNLAGVKTGVQVEDVMTKKPFFIQPELSILDCMRTIVNTRYRRLPVVEDEVVGMVTAGDLLKYVYGKKFKFDAIDAGIEHVMVKYLMIAEKEDDVGEVVKKMVDNQIGGILVVDKGRKPLGIITERDILEEIVFK